ncbi:MAG: protein translocase subunit SecF, partial [Cyanobacteria bacterium]|nr:protein translocase subunit SecF [Cyanobacteriota bacterium]
LELDCTKPGNCDQPIDLNQVRAILSQQGIDSSNVQVAGDRFQAISIRAKELPVNQRTQLVAALQDKIGTFDPTKTQIDTVGPTLGAQLFRSGVLALLMAFVGITIYLTFRFQLDYAIFALVALMHDVLVTLGVFALLGLTIGTEVDSLFIVALLTIIGFSVNDTVVIYDRVRETIERATTEHHINDIINDAVNQTLGRSINTTMTTLLPLIAIFLLGGETLKFFALALIIGFIAGAYSSIFIASTLLALWRELRGHAVIVPIANAEVSEPQV